MKKLAVIFLIFFSASAFSGVVQHLPPVSGIASGSAFDALTLNLPPGNVDGGTFGYCAVATNAAGNKIASCGQIVYVVVNQSGTFTATYTILGNTETSPGSSTISLAAPTTTSAPNRLTIRSTITVTNFTPVAIEFHRTLFSFCEPSMAVAE